MIEWEGQGNLLLDRTFTQLCPINAVGVMGRGLAQTMRDTYPGLYDRYQAVYHPKHSPVKSVDERAQILTHVTDLPSEVKVLLFCTKTHWRWPSPIELVRFNLEQLRAQWQTLGIERLSMPLVGTGLGGLPTRQVRHLIYHYLDDQALPIRLYV